MDPCQQKAQFSIAYVHAVATVAGFATSETRVDDDSVDFVIAQRGGSGTIRSPRLDVQLKCTEQDFFREDGIHFPLKRKNYDDLRPIDLMVQRILVVMHVPCDVKDWLAISPSQMILRNCAWWVSLYGAAERPGVETPTVLLPRAQVFTPEALSSIMERVGRREQP